MDKRYHYTYKVTFPTRGWFYYGLHSTNNLNDNYQGSPTTHKEKWENYDWELTPLEFFDTREEAADVEHRIIKHTMNNPNSLNENCGTAFSIEVAKKAGRKGGQAAVESGQLAAARKKCHNEKQRIGSSKAIMEWNKRRPPEVHERALRAAQRRSLLLRSRPVILEKDGLRFLFPSVVAAAKILSLHSSNLFNILNGKRQGPHKGWNITSLDGTC